MITDCRSSLSTYAHKLRQLFLYQKGEERLLPSVLARLPDHLDQQNCEPIKDQK